MSGTRREINESVGNNGRNLRPDVDAIQEMLNMAPPFEGGPSQLLKVDGIVGNKTIGAIQRFQLHRFGWSGADGRLDPDHQTMRWLRAMEGGYGRTAFQLARAELASGVQGVSDAYFAILGKGGAFYSLGTRPEPDPTKIAERLTFSSNPNQWRSFQTQQMRGVRSFETKAAQETIYHDPQVPSQSKVLLQLDLPRADARTDFVHAMVIHRWIHDANRPTGYRTAIGSFYLIKATY